LLAPGLRSKGSRDIIRQLVEVGTDLYLPRPFATLATVENSIKVSATVKNAKNLQAIIGGPGFSRGDS
jgi:hypothetical protein